jgi:hypothetical protein
MKVLHFRGVSYMRSQLLPLTPFNWLEFDNMCLFEYLSNCSTKAPLICGCANHDAGAQHFCFFFDSRCFIT